MSPRVRSITRKPACMAESMFRTQFHSRPGLYHDWTPSDAVHSAFLRDSFRTMHGLDHSWSIAQVRTAFDTCDPGLRRRLELLLAKARWSRVRITTTVSRVLQAFVPYANILCSSALEIREGSYGLGVFALKPFDGLSPLPLLVGAHTNASASDFEWLCRVDPEVEGATCRRGISIIQMNHSEPRFWSQARHEASKVESQSARLLRHRRRAGRGGRIVRRGRHWQQMHKYDVVFSGPLSYLNHSSSAKTMNVYPYARGSNAADGCEHSWWQAAHVIGGNPLKPGDELLLDYGPEYAKILRTAATKRKRDEAEAKKESKRAKCNSSDPEMPGSEDDTSRVLRSDLTRVSASSDVTTVDPDSASEPVSTGRKLNPDRPLSRWRSVSELRMSLRNRSAE